ncbi:MAG: peptidylprolyl isomerase [Kiritimatiellae bacterium]|nr:peptidylprolyl isomerase [Kiritimatiellia bacterium]
MKTSNLIIGLLVLGLLGSGARGLPGAERRSVRLDGVAAWVNERFITIGDVVLAMEPLRRQIETKRFGGNMGQRLQKAYEETLESLIARLLAVAEFEAQKRFQVPEWMVDRRIEEIVRESFGGDRSAFLEALTRDHVPFDEWRTHLREQIIFMMMRRANVEDRIFLPASAVRKAYEENVENYRKPGRVKLRLIWVGRGRDANEASKRREEAEKIRDRVVSGEDFGTVAAAHSEDQYAKQGGDWGWIDPGVLRPELAKVAASLPTNTVSDVIETRDGWYILKVEGRHEETTVPFEEVQPRIESDLRRQAAEREHEQWMARLKKRFRVWKLEPPALE